MLRMGVGHSDDVDPHVAIQVAIDECRKSLGGLNPTAALLFSTADGFDPSVIQVVRDAFQGIDVIGSTSSAEISSLNGYQEDSISLAVFASDEVEMGTGLGSGFAQDVDAASRKAVEQALSGTTKQPRLCIVFHDSFTVDPAKVTQALARALPQGVEIFGGSSGRNDFMSDTPTRQFRNDAVVGDGVAVMLLCGPLAHSTALGMGFRPIGPMGTVTRADAVAVHEIDRRPAAEFVRRYLDALGPASYGNPLAVYEDGSEDFYLRVMRDPDTDTGSLQTAGSIPVGAKVQLTTADTDEVLAGTRSALERALAGFPAGKQPEAALIFSCAVRKFMLGSRTRVEAELAKSVLGPLPTAGLYCFGEVSPVPGVSTSRFLNETFVTLLLGT